MVRSSKLSTKIIVGSFWTFCKEFSQRQIVGIYRNNIGNEWQLGLGSTLGPWNFENFQLSNMQIFSHFLGSFFKTCMCMSNRYTCCRVVRISRLVPPRGSHKGHYCAPCSSRADRFDPVTLVFMRGAHARLTGDTVM